MGNQKKHPINHNFNPNRDNKGNGGIIKSDGSPKENNKGLRKKKGSNKGEGSSTLKKRVKRNDNIDESLNQKIRFRKELIKI